MYCKLNQSREKSDRMPLMSTVISYGRGNSINIPRSVAPKGSSTKNNFMILIKFAVKSFFLAGGNGWCFVTSGMADSAAFVVTVLPVFATAIGIFIRMTIVAIMTMTVTTSATIIMNGELPVVAVC